MSARVWIALFAAAAFAAPAGASIVEEIIALPVEVRDIQGRTHRHAITVTVFRDTQRARSPFLVLSHGRTNAEGRARLGRVRYSANSRYFVSRGFAVFVPTRIGYGITGGEDVEYSGRCSSREFEPAFEAGAVQVMAVIDHARSQSFVDAGRGLLVGQSVGGAVTIALAAKNLPGIVAAVNFAGGAGGRPLTYPDDPCSEPVLRGVLGKYGETSRIPMVWLYSENDRYWGPTHPRSWFEAFRKQGGAGEFVRLPPYGSDGHPSFTRNPDAWKPTVERFLTEQGFLR